MRTSKYSGRMFAFILSAFVSTGSVIATSANTDLTDVWWNPAESGWGMEIVNTGTFAFASLYVYDPNGSPTWLSGQLQKVPGAPATYSGPLFVTTGPYYGGAFNPSAVTMRQVGTMTFVGTTTTTGQLTYSVDGLVVNKLVERQPITLDNYNGNYTGVVTYTDSGCTNPADNGTGTGQVSVNITQNGSSMAFGFSASNGNACSLVGAYAQRGRMGQVSGNYSCTDGTVGTATLFEMNNVPFMFTARMQSHDNVSGCNESAEFAGVIPR